MGNKLGHITLILPGLLRLLHLAFSISPFLLSTSFPFWSLCPAHSINYLELLPSPLPFDFLLAYSFSSFKTQPLLKGLFWFPHLGWRSVHEPEHSASLYLSVHPNRLSSCLLFSAGLAAVASSTPWSYSFQYPLQHLAQSRWSIGIVTDGWHWGRPDPLTSKFPFTPKVWVSHS